MRVFAERLCCDACNGIFVTVEDLARSIAELTASEPTLAFRTGELGARPCPRCATAMTTVKLDVHLDGRHPKLWPELDQCTAHGVWFDDLELAKIFQILHAAVWPAGYGKGGMLDLGRKTKF